MLKNIESGDTSKKISKCPEILKSGTFLGPPKVCICNCP
jgi:hypothetical protein